MTDKQIIIDGVDVSGCECIIEDYQRANNFKGRYEHIKNVCELGERGAEYYNLFCKDNPNCYYKQLQAKEQECKRLKHDNGYEVGALEKTIDNLKAENEELKDIRDRNFLHALEEQKRADKLSKTLTEIKKIAEKGHKEKGNLMRTWWFKEILQKISECEGNDEN